MKTIAFAESETDRQRHWSFTRLSIERIETVRASHRITQENKEEKKRLSPPFWFIFY